VHVNKQLAAAGTLADSLVNRLMSDAMQVRSNLCLQSTAAVQCKSLGVSREQCQQLLAATAAAAAALQQHLLAANNS
jgi:hypothetical protein